MLIKRYKPIFGKLKGFYVAEQQQTIDLRQETTSNYAVPSCFHILFAVLLSFISKIFFGLQWPIERTNAF